MKRYHIQIDETIATILVDDEFLSIISEEILRQRKILKEYILNDSLFLSSLLPYDAPYEGIPEIAERMFYASKVAGVGPMACVAGAIAYFAARAARKAGAKFVVVDNGGDIAYFIDKSLNVGIYSGLNSYFNNLGFKLEPCEEIKGVCTSSATVGPSISFGCADAAVVFSDDVILADAMATSLGNAIKRENYGQTLSILKNKMVQGIRGLLVIVDDLMCLFGDLPRVITTEMNYDLITKG